MSGVWFVKKKTAYMRLISDWISDVCSSDLVAELVLQPHQRKGVLRPVRQPPRQQEATQPAGCLRQYKEPIRHRRREEPLVPDQRVLVATERRGRSGVRAHVAAALLLGHAHAQGHAGLARDGDVTRVVAACGHLVRPLRSEEHTSELQSLMRSSYAVFCLQNKNTTT